MKASPDTIAAVATPPGRGGIGVVRVSGANAQRIALALVSRPLPPRLATLASFLDADGAVLDQGLALLFPAPHSYTGESVLELHAHGGPAVLALLLERCLALGARLARPGEFTERAFLAGKLDLAQAEGVADLIDAATRTAARAAARSLSGEFSREVTQLVDGLVALRGLTEATLDFPDEDLDFLKAADAAGRLDALRHQLGTLLARAQQGALLREGLTVVLVGPPNVGKSSLLNRLTREDTAIVTEYAGTTRDPLHGAIELDGIPLTVIDTAGLRETTDPIETVGIERTWAAVGKADLALVLEETGQQALTSDSQDILQRLPWTLPRVRVVNKIDLTGERPRRESAGAAGAPSIWLSARTGEGLELLEAAILELAKVQSGMEGAFLARARHLEALRTGSRHLERAAGQLTGPVPPLELFAEELRGAQVALAAITGEFTADDLLGVIFSRFCLGK